MRTLADAWWFKGGIRHRIIRWLRFHLLVDALERFVNMNNSDIVELQSEVAELKKMVHELASEPGGGVE